MKRKSRHPFKLGMYASFIIPFLVFAALLFHALQRLKTHLNGLAIGENAAYLLDVVISGIGYSFFNNLILWIGAVLALCTAGSVLAHMFIKNQNRSRLYWCIACMTIALLFPYLCIHPLASTPPGGPHGPEETPGLSPCPNSL